MARTFHTEVRHGAVRVRDIATRGNRLRNTDSLGRDVNSKSVGHREHMFRESEPHSLFKRARLSEFRRRCGGPRRRGMSVSGERVSDSPQRATARYAMSPALLLFCDEDFRLSQFLLIRPAHCWSIPTRQILACDVRCGRRDNCGGEAVHMERW